MSIVISLLLIVEVLAAFLLVVVILAQKSKDQGLGMAFGSGMGESLFGSRAGNVLTRMTVTLTVVFLLTTIVLGVLFSKGKGVRSTGSVMDKAGTEAPLAPAAPVAPAAPLAAPASPTALPEAPAALPADASSAPIALQMGEGGGLQPVETAPAATEAPAVPAEEAPAAPATEGEPVPQN